MKNKSTYLALALILGISIISGCTVTFTIPTDVSTLPPTLQPLIPPTPIPYNPIVAISPASGSAGTQVQVVASGFTPNTSVSVALGPVNSGFGEVAHGTTDSNGTFVAQVPVQGEPGMELVFAVAAEGQPGVLSASHFQITGTVPNPQPIIPTPTPYLEMWATYSNPAFAVSLAYPVEWQPISGSGSPATGEIRFGGVNGFFLMGAMDTDSLDMAVTAEAEHILQPYGANPTIEALQIQGQDARLILPSENQPNGMQHQASIIIRYPQPVNVLGTPCRFFILWADQPHIRAIAQTIQFLQ